MKGISRPMTWPTTRSSGPSPSRAILAGPWDESLPRRPGFETTIPARRTDDSGSGDNSFCCHAGESGTGLAQEWCGGSAALVVGGGGSKIGKGAHRSLGEYWGYLPCLLSQSVCERGQTP